MSASPVDNESMTPVIKSTVISVVLGGLAMAARLLLSEHPVSAGYIIRRLAAAGITAAFVGWGITDYVASVTLRYCLIGICAYSAPEVADAAARWLRNKMNKAVDAEAPKKRVKRHAGRKTKR